MPSIKISKNEKWEQKIDEYTLEKNARLKSRWS
jgi:hypothetical protein